MKSNEKPQKVIIFDDNKISNFYPLTLNRSTSDLRCGILKLRQRINAYFQNKNQSLITLIPLENLYKIKHPSWQINRVANVDTLFC